MYAPTRSSRQHIDVTPVQPQVSQRAIIETAQDAPFARPIQAIHNAIGNCHNPDRSAAGKQLQSFRDQGARLCRRRASADCVSTICHDTTSFVMVSA